MESVYFFADGNVELKPLPFEIMDERFVPPEGCQDSGQKSDDLDKVGIFCMICTLINKLLRLNCFIDVHIFVWCRFNLRP